jgi:hypothetical protein
MGRTNSQRRGRGRGGLVLEDGAQGCQIFLGTKHQNGKKYQITIKITKWQQNIPNGRK